MKYSWCIFGIVTCPAFNVSNGGKIYANTTMLSDYSYIHPTALFIYCPYGTLPLWNSTTVFCQANGTWSHDIDHCTGIKDYHWIFL